MSNMKIFRWHILRLIDSKNSGKINDAWICYLVTLIGIGGIEKPVNVFYEKNSSNFTGLDRLISRTDDKKESDAITASIKADVRKIIGK